MLLVERGSLRDIDGMESDSQSRPSDTPSKPRRRWFQYSISTLLLLTTVSRALLAYMVNPARRQRLAREYVEGLGGGVRYSENSVELYLSGTQVNDAGLAHLKWLAGLKVLSLEGAQVSDAGLANLQGLTSLELLKLNDTQVGDAGLATLSRSTGLKTLSLKGTKISDSGLMHLRGLTGLKVLSLQHTRVGDEGLSHLKRMPALEWLDLRFTRVSDAGVEELQDAMPNCMIHH